VRKIDPALENLVGNEQGKLDAIFGAQHAILVPPDVELVAPSRPDGSIEALYLRYPVEDGGQKKWQDKTDTNGLLNDFLRLAQDHITEEGILKVVKFARIWGPVWACVNPEHDRNLFGCYFMPRAYETRYESPCTWTVEESPLAFITAARQAKAMVRAAQLLRDNMPVPQEVWDALKPARVRVSPHTTALHKLLVALSGQEDAPSRKRYLSLLVNEHLLELG